MRQEYNPHPFEKRNDGTGTLHADDLQMRRNNARTRGWKFISSNDPAQWYDTGVRYHFKNPKA